MGGSWGCEKLQIKNVKESWCVCVCGNITNFVTTRTYFFSSPTPHPFFPICIVYDRLIRTIWMNLGLTPCTSNIDDFVSVCTGTKGKLEVKTLGALMVAKYLMNGPSCWFVAIRRCQ